MRVLTIFTLIGHADMGDLYQFFDDSEVPKVSK